MKKGRIRRKTLRRLNELFTGTVLLALPACNANQQSIPVGLDAIAADAVGQFVSFLFALARGVLAAFLL